MVSDNILRLIEKASGFEGADASLVEVSGEVRLVLVAKGKVCAILLDTPFSEDTSLAVAIVRSMIHQLQAQLSEPDILKIKAALEEGENDKSM
jgi:hypothetical protein